MAQRDTIQAGQDVDSFCGKCGLELAHIVVAKAPGRAARVKCKTCGAEHAMRASKPKASSKSTTGRAAPARKTKASQASYEQLVAEALGDRDPSEARTWNLGTRFDAGELLMHKTFGLGVVESLTAPNKIVVLFATSGRKVLLHAQMP